MVKADAVKERFSGVPVGLDFENFFAVFAEENDRFAVLVIRIDDFEKILKQLGESITTNLVIRLARIIDGLSKTASFEWGQISGDEFGCLCRDMDEPAGLELAEEVQRRLALAGKETVSIGLAVCPFWPFEKTAILANARKALDHAEFFGANTITPFDAVSLNISADKLYQYGDIEGAVEEFKKALAVDPENVNVHNSLGVCYGVRGELEAAIEAFEEALRLDPEDVMATFNLGLAHFKKGDKDTALGLFLDAHGLDGDNPEVAYKIGLCFQEKKEADKALVYYEMAAARTHKGAHVFRGLGECYVEKGMFSEAAKAYEKAIRRNPRDAKSLNTLGHVYGILGENLEIAIVLCRESTEIDPENGLFRVRLARLYQQNEEHEKAREQFQLARDLGEDCADAIQEPEAPDSDEE